MRLIINNIEADFFNEPALNKKLIDINNLSDRFITFSYSLSLPKTAKNNQIFQSAYDLNVDVDHFSITYIATLVFSSEIFKCSLKLLSIEKDRYQVQVVERTAELFNQFSTKINDYDFNCYSEVSGGLIINQNFDFDNNSLNSLYFNNIQQTNLLPSYADYYDTADLSPIKWLLADFDINAETNFKIPFFSINNMLRHIITKNGYEFEADNDVVFTGNINKMSYKIGVIEDTTPETFSEFCYPDSDKLRIEDINTFSEFYVNNTTENDYIIDVVLSDSTAGKVTTESIFVEANNFTFKRLKDVNLGQDSYYTMNNSSGLVPELTVYSELKNINFNNDDDLEIHTDYIPDYTFSDLIKAYCFVNNVVPIVENNVFKFENLNDQSTFFDISDKIDYSSITITSFGLANNNYFNYNNDETVDKLLGQGVFESAGKDDRELFKLNFSASTQTDRLNIPIMENGLLIPEQELINRVGKINDGKATAINLQDIADNDFYSLLGKNKRFICESLLTLTEFRLITAGTVIYIEEYGKFKCFEISEFVYGRKCKMGLIKI